MTPTAAEVLQSAMALGPDERLDVAAQLVNSVEDAGRWEALRVDVAAGFEQIDRDEGVVLDASTIGAYLQERSRVAAARAHE